MGDDPGLVNYHAEQIAMLDPEKRAEMVAFLRRWIPDPEQAAIRRRRAADPDWWCAHHFRWGMAVRNALRSAGYSESRIGIGNLDDVWVPLVEEAAVAGGGDG